MLNLGEFPSVLVRFEARFNAILFSACGDSCYDVTLYYIVFSGFHSFFIPFFRKYILTILLSVYLLFSHIFMFNHFFLRSFFFWPVMMLRILNTLDSTIKKSSICEAHLKIYFVSKIFSGTASYKNVVFYSILDFISRDSFLSPMQ